MEGLKNFLGCRTRSANIGNDPGIPGHVVHPRGGWVCKIEQAQCEIQGKPLFKETSRMLSRGGKQVASNASFAKALPRWPCNAVSLHSAQSAPGHCVSLCRPADGPVTFLAVVLTLCSCSWPDLAGPVGQAILITSTTLPVSRPNV